MSLRQFGRLCAVLALSLVFSPRSLWAQSPIEHNFLPEAPVSEYLPVAENGPDHGFCSKWDPEYGYRGKACCERVPVFTRRTAAKCSPLRIKWTTSPVRRLAQSLAMQRRRWNSAPRLKSARARSGFFSGNRRELLRPRMDLGLGLDPATFAVWTTA